ncbi:DUF6147 family protein [Enterocloster citroniae]|uniref:DUF6147 family protein n=1 Tax=Enterocloster citroniae TaxID=358743 RepID=UPI0032C0AA18
MKRLLYTSIATIMILITISLNAFAMPYNPDNYTSVDEVSALLPAGVKQSKVSKGAVTRGNFFMGADLVIRDNGDGTVGALAIAYTAIPIDEAYTSVYLDQWDETTERWRQVNYYEAEFYKADYPDGLKTPTVDISFTGQPRGRYYRLRGVFGVVSNGEFEGASATTDGVLLN